MLYKFLLVFGCFVPRTQNIYILDDSRGNKKNIKQNDAKKPSKNEMRILNHVLRILQNLVIEISIILSEVELIPIWPWGTLIFNQLLMFSTTLKIYLSLNSAENSLKKHKKRSIKKWNCKSIKRIAKYNFYNKQKQWIQFLMMKSQFNKIFNSIQLLIFYFDYFQFKFIWF